MKKTRFVIVGSGWRAAFYVRLAKVMSDRFELLYMLCRSSEKAEQISDEFDIPVTTSISDCIEAEPDFVVVAVSKSSISQVSLEWLDRGFFVLAETPAALDFENLKLLKNLGEKGRRLVIAEQYHLYPENREILSLLEENLIGKPDCLNISLAHDYHAMSLIRAFLRIPLDEKFSVRAKSYFFETTETFTRYEHFTDGRSAPKKRCVAVFEFENGKVAFYDFDSEQYRSPIRKNSLKIQGARGEIIDGKIFYLDSKNEACQKSLYSETEEFSQDESALALLLQEMADYVRGEGKNPYPLEEALQDSFMAILMHKAEASGERLSSEDFLPEGK